MSKDTWNFPCHQPIDNRVTIPADPTTGGMTWGIGPGTQGQGYFSGGSDTQPFTDTMTYIFSMLVRSSWTSQDDKVQGIMSIGYRSAAEPSFGIQFIDSGTTPRIRVFFADGGTGVVRYKILLGDEVSGWFKDDKWYQIGISANSSGITFVVNGSTTPERTILTDAPAAINLEQGNDRVWFLGPDTNAFQNSPSLIAEHYPSMVLGAAALSTQSLDFSNSTVRDRIWDSNGDFKNCGEDGSLWFADVYGANTPEWYFVDGSPRLQNGSDSGIWGNESNIAMTSAAGGLRKQHE